MAAKIQDGFKNPRWLPKFKIASKGWLANAQLGLHFKCFLNYTD